MSSSQLREIDASVSKVVAAESMAGGVRCELIHLVLQIDDGLVKFIDLGIHFRPPDADIVKGGGVVIEPALD